MTDIVRIPGGVDITAGIGDSLTLGVTIKDAQGPLDISGWTLEAEGATLTVVDASIGQISLAFQSDVRAAERWSLRRASPQAKRLLAGSVQYVLSAGPSTPGTLIEVTLEDAPELIIDIVDQGEVGPQGPQGEPGPGIPSGGVEFDLIEKASGTDFDTRFTSAPTVRGLQLDTANPADAATGRLVWNDGDEVPQFVSNGITVDLSLEMLARCRNVTGTLIPKGTAVCIVGSSANRISIAPSDRTEPGSACRTLGLTLEDIPNNNFGKVSTFGLVRGLNTAGIVGDEGDELFVGETPGSLTTTPPDAPARRLTVGYLVTKSTTQGRIFVSIRRGVKVEEIDDVQVGTAADGDVLRYDDAAGRWENVQITARSTATVQVADWSGAEPAVATITVAGLLDTDHPLVDLDLSAAAFSDVQGLLDDWDVVYRTEASGDDELTLFALNQPTQNLPISITVIR